MVIGSFIASAFQAPRMTGRERIICHISYTSSMGLNVSGGPYSQCKELETLGSRRLRGDGVRALSCAETCQY
jgi:hypothetical protein